MPFYFVTIHKDSPTGKLLDANADFHLGEHPAWSGQRMEDTNPAFVRLRRKAGEERVEAWVSVPVACVIAIHEVDATHDGNRIPFGFVANKDVS
jgi:hypothetical protein